MIGQSIAHYRVTSLLGEGGMGKVYEATDTRLNRRVALKILPEVYAGDRQRMERFQREAEVLASLSHPHVGQIYGIEDVGATKALVLELIEGPTLADRLAAGRLAVPEILSLALQVAEGLEAAHERGIVHRDLKPANIKINPEGQVKILDFGLAKALEAGTGSAATADSPTLTVAATEAGLIMGTAGYMAPEQARGEAVDRRADIWAFGVVLWEMLTGSSPFSGRTVSDMLASVLRDSLPLDQLPASLPPSLLRLLDRCLQRDLCDRLQSIGDARLELVAAQDELARGGRSPGETDRTSPGWLRWLPWGIAGVLAIALLLLWLHVPDTGQGPEPSYTWTVAPPPGTEYVLNQGAPALAPNDARLVFVARNQEGVRELWLRQLNELEARVIPDTREAGYPFWSPDGRWIGFVVDDELRRIDPSGGQSERIASLGGGSYGGTWGSDGSILMTSQAGLSLLRVLPGGETKPVVFDQLGREFYSAPQFLPGSSHFLLSITNLGGGREGLFIGSERGLTNKLSDGAGRAQISAGKVVSWREGTLRAVSLDRENWELVGETYAIAEGVSYSSNTNQAYFSINPDLLVFLKGPPAEPGELAWVDRQGGNPQTIAQNGDYYRPRLSPDGSQLAVDLTSPNTGNGDLWVFDTVRGASQRLTAEPTNESYPVWSPDGSEIIYFDDLSIYRRFASGRGEKVPILSGDVDRVWPADWSPDGKQLLYHKGLGPGVGSDLWVLDLASGKTTPFITSEQFVEEDATFSPDGKWVAYSSNESGQFEVYLQDFPERFQKIRVSLGGGQGPRWSARPAELFYLAPGKGVMEVPITTDPDLKAGTPQLLFEAGIKFQGGEAFFDVSKDGQRFLITKESDQTTIAPLTVRSGWTHLDASGSR